MASIRRIRPSQTPLLRVRRPYGSGAVAVSCGRDGSPGHPLPPLGHPRGPHGEAPGGDGLRRREPPGVGT